MNIKLFGSELKVMEVLWEMGNLSAKQIVDVLIDLAIIAYLKV